MEPTHSSDQPEDPKMIASSAAQAGHQFPEPTQEGKDASIDGHAGEGDNASEQSAVGSSQKELAANFKKMRDAVLAKKLVLKELLEKRGDKVLYDYAKEYIHVNLNPPIQHRQNELLETFGEEVERLLGKEVAAQAVEQLSKHYFVSTADHHGPVCNPFFLNSNLITAAPYFEHDDPSLKYVIALPCASISFDNSSFPRGLQFHSAIDPEKPKLISIGFLPRSVRPCPVVGFRAYTKDDITRAQKMLRDAVRENEILPKEMEFMTKLLEDVYLKPEVLACKTFSEQMTKTNFDLWRGYFHSSKTSAPDLIYLEQESVVSKLILKYHLDTDTTITHFLFDSNYDPLINQFFDGIQGAFSSKDGWGTYLFWGFPKGSKYRVQLWKKGNALETSDGSYRLELTPDNVRRALTEGEIFPSTMLDFIVLSFYYGLKCLGGFSQVNYLTYMKNAYIKMQLERGNYRSIEVCARAQTKELGGDLSVAFLRTPGGNMLPATGVDLLLYGSDQTWPTLLEVCKSITLEESIDILLPELYRIVYAEPDRDPELLKVGPENVFQVLGLDKKVSACASI